MYSRLVIINILTLFFLSGCVLFSPELKALKEVNQSQKDIDSYLNNQDELFEKLVGDIKTKHLNFGISKTEFIEIYGEPVLVENYPDSLGKEVMLYRHPTEYFNSDKVYVHFNQAGELIHWEYIPRLEE